MKAERKAVKQISLNIERDLEALETIIRKSHHDFMIIKSWISLLPIDAEECYFCVHHHGFCDACEYGKIHGVCDDPGSDYRIILDNIFDLKTFINELSARKGFLDHLSVATNTEALHISTVSLLKRMRRARSAERVMEIKKQILLEWLKWMPLPIPKHLKDTMCRKKDALINLIDSLYYRRGEVYE